MKKQTVLILALFVLPTLAVGAPQAGSSMKMSMSGKAHSTAPKAPPSLLKPDTLKLQAPAVFSARFTTTKGDFVVEVTRAWSPRGADRFYNLVKYHFFDDAAFFRVVEGFVVQFGISARPDVAKAWENARVIDDPVMEGNKLGTLTFATSGPNTRTTQLFINLADNGNLDSMGFSPFGKVTSGMDVVAKLYGGYGEGAPNGNGPDQGRIQSEGKAYLQKSFPLLDTIKTAVIVPPAPVAGVKPAAATAAKPAVKKP
jgi:peptidyl-prolyl cis-trans isomerase A (cyclophilin A)